MRSHLFTLREAPQAVQKVHQRFIGGGFGSILAEQPKLLDCRLQSGIHRWQTRRNGPSVLLKGIAECNKESQLDKSLDSLFYLRVNTLSSGTFGIFQKSQIIGEGACLSLKKMCTGSVYDQGFFLGPPEDPRRGFDKCPHPPKISEIPPRGHLTWEKICGFIPPPLV